MPRIVLFPIVGFLRRIPHEEDRKRKHLEEKLQQIVLFWVCFASQPKYGQTMERSISILTCSPSLKTTSEEVIMRDFFVPRTSMYREKSNSLCLLFNFRVIFQINQMIAPLSDIFNMERWLQSITLSTGEGQQQFL